VIGKRRPGLTVAVLFVLTVAVMGLLGRGRGGAAYERFSGSSYGSGRWGVRGLYETLSERGWRVARWRRAEPPEARGAVLLMIGPLKEPEAGELIALDRWMRLGNTLIYFAPAEGPGGGGHFDERFRSTLRFAVRVEDKVGRLTWRREALSWREWRASVLEPVERPVWGGADRVAGVGSVALQADCEVFPLSREWRTTVRSARRTILAQILRDAFSAAWAQRVDPGRRLVIEREVGRGRMVVVGSASVASNAYLARAGNARLVENLLQAHAPGGRVIFDEYRHGFLPGAHPGRRLPVAVLVLFGQALVWALVFVVSQGRRFGPPAAEGGEGGEGRDRVAFAASLGGLYARAGARAHALERLELELAERAGCPRAAGEEGGELAGRVAERADLDAGEVRALLDEVRAARAGGRIRTARFVQLAARLTGILVRVRGPVRPVRR
jgi:hypothetical protein